MKFGDRWTDEQAHLVDLLAKTWVRTWSWPTFSYVADLLDDQGYSATETLRSFPILGDSAFGRASYGDVFFDHAYPSPPDDSIVGLSVSGLARHPLGEDSALTFVAVLKVAADEYRLAPLDPTSVRQVTLTLDHAAELIPGAQQDILLAVGLLFGQEPIRGRRSSSREPESGRWSITLGRQVVGYRDLTIERYLATVAEDVEPGPVPTPVTVSERSESPRSVVSMSSPREGNKVFISHAGADRALGALLHDTLVLGGVPGDRIFYSSARATGVPTGTDVRSRLRQELSQAGLVIELLTPTFFTRPMCLMELGGAWAIGSSTYPIVIPPMELEEAIKILGDVNMGQLTSESLIDETFDELRDRLASALQLKMQSAAWNASIRKFKQSFRSELAAPTNIFKSTSPQSARETSTSSSSGESITISDVSTKDAFGGGVKVLGRATNTTAQQLTVLLKAIFLCDGRIIETADGAVSQLGAGGTKTFEIQTLGPVNTFDTVQVQVEQSF